MFVHVLKDTLVWTANQVSKRYGEIRQNRTIFWFFVLWC